MTGPHQPYRQYQAAPGWYPDPSGGPWWRYFDGYQWTHHVHTPKAQQPQPQVFTPPGPQNTAISSGGPAPVAPSPPQDQSSVAAITSTRAPVPELPDLDAMRGIDFENFVASLYRSRGFEVLITKASGDFGADLIVAASGGLRRNELDPESYDFDGWSDRMAVQCKRYSGAVGVSAVSAVVAGKGMYDCHKAAVVTNSTFTAQARQLAEAHDVVMIDGPRLWQMYRASLHGDVPLWPEFPDHETCGICYAAKAIWHDATCWMCTDCAAAVGHRESTDIIVKWGGNCAYCKVPLAVGAPARYGSSQGLGRGILHCRSDSCGAAHLRYAEWAQNEVENQYR